mmetsp:Transcript_6146/g.4650  ORF Transcript_6146/g.4650 Transcript_6146/m.4650 type:complete len:104 (+) Transcript_6146:450-761(+)
MGKRKKKIDEEDGVMYLTDEVSEGEQEEEKSSELPGNQQLLETPSVSEQLNFSLLKVADLFPKSKKEVYKMKSNKLQGIECQFCSLIFDFTSCCTHHSALKDA